MGIWQLRGHHRGDLQAGRPKLRPEDRFAYREGLLQQRPHCLPIQPLLPYLCCQDSHLQGCLWFCPLCQVLHDPWRALDQVQWQYLGHSSHGVAPVVVAADCSAFHRFAIKAQHIKQGVWNTEIILKKNLIKVVPTATLPTVLVNGTPIQIPVGKVVIVKDIEDHTVIAEALMTPDHVVVVKAPRFLLEEVKTNGQIIEVVPSVQLKNKLCVVCGNFQKPIMSETITGHCVYSKPELEIASWTIPTGSSSVMSPSILSELKTETEMCPKMTVLPTEVAKAYKVATGKCTILRHLIQKGPGQVCLSKIPVTQCGPSCKPQKSQLTVKAVPFTCLPEGPVVEKLVAKVIIGQELPELATKVTSFAAQVRMPAHCVHALVTKGI